MLNKEWRTLNGDKVNLRASIEEELKGHPESIIDIGSDSQQIGQRTEYVTVVTVRRPKKGGRVFFCREVVPRVRELRERLWKEVWRSTELAMQLTEAPDIGGISIKIDAVHIDANPVDKHKSSKYVEELVGLVVGQGFQAVIKPDSWAAAHAADHAVKHKNERMPRSRNRMSA